MGDHEIAYEGKAAMPVGDDGNSGNVWKLILSYDGTDFHGWQVQPGRATIQGILAEAIASVTRRTGVAARIGANRCRRSRPARRDRVASFSLRAPIPADNLQRALNRILPAAIRILSAEHAPEGFHARHSAAGKVYQYRIFQRGWICSPFMARYATACRWPLDLQAMQLAADMILGEHDFTSFAASDPDRAARFESEDACDADDSADAEEFIVSACNQPAASRHPGGLVGQNTSPCRVPWEERW